MCVARPGRRRLTASHRGWPVNVAINDALNHVDSLELDTLPA
jgi:hypothetical protein